MPLDEMNTVFPEVSKHTLPIHEVMRKATFQVAIPERQMSMRRKMRRKKQQKIAREDAHPGRRCSVRGLVRSDPMPVVHGKYAVMQ